MDLSRLRLYDGSKVLKETYLCYMDRWNAWFDVVVRGKARAYRLNLDVLIDEKRRYLEQLRRSKKVNDNASLDQFM